MLCGVLTACDQLRSVATAGTDNPELLEILSYKLVELLTYKVDIYLVFFYKKIMFVVAKFKLEGRCSLLQHSRILCLYFCGFSTE